MVYDVARAIARASAACVRARGQGTAKDGRGGANPANPANLGDPSGIYKSYFLGICESANPANLDSQDQIPQVTKDCGTGWKKSE